MHEFCLLGNNDHLDNDALCCNLVVVTFKPLESFDDGQKMTFLHIYRCCKVRSKNVTVVKKGRKVQSKNTLVWQI